MKPEPGGTFDSVDYLKETYSNLAKANPSYSLRAFAAKLGLSPGGLSQILNRKKKISVQRAYDLAKKLALAPRETDYFLSLVQIDSAKSFSLKADLTDRLLSQYPQKNQMHDLSLERFRFISSWYGLAVYELLMAHEGVGTAQKISTYFGITYAEASETLERLEKLGLVEKSKGGEYKSLNGSVMVSSDVPNEGLRHYYESIHAKSVESVHAQTPKEKIIGSQVITFDPSQMEEVRKLTDKFLNSLEHLASKGKKRTEVYQAIFNFFKLNKSSLKRSSS